MKPIGAHTEAMEELAEAMAFYESRAVGLGIDLLEKVDAAFARIQQSPEAWPLHKRGRFRKFFVERFPYVVFYLELPESILVVAIAHASRRPDYWTRRKVTE